MSFLVVEDHPFQREMLVRMLKQLDARAVYEAGEGARALEILDDEATAIDVVVTDLDMPTVDGMELLRRMALAGHRASVVVASGLERPLLASTEAMAAAYGVRLLATIEKPVTPAKLRAALALYGQPTRVVQQAAARQYPQFTPEEVLLAIEQRQFEPFFQPQIHVATGQVRGAEALARWRHPRHGVVPPAAFMAPLEAAGAAVALTLLVVDEAARTARLLREAAQPATMCVNISQQSFGDVALADRIVDRVRVHGVDPEDFVLEVSESAAGADFARVLDNLVRLRMKGFGLAIDDYGQGYSSLQQLTQIPFSELKIDQSFVTQSGRRDSTRLILQSSLELARSLRIRSVAEGVETRENWELLRELGCDIAQGFHIAAPTPAADYAEWVRAWPEASRR